MSDEIERRLRRTFEERSADVDVPSRLYETVMARAERHRRRTRALTVAATALVVVLVGALAAFVQGDSDARLSTEPLPDGWQRDRDPVLGWRFSYPEEWKLDRFAKQCRVGYAGTVIANGQQIPRFNSTPDGCTAQRHFRNLPDDFVAIEIRRVVGGRAAPASRVPTELPLTFSDLTGPTKEESNPRIARYGRVVVLDDARYEITAWIGTAASEADRGAARRVVESVRAAPADSYRRCERATGPAGIRPDNDPLTVEFCVSDAEPHVGEEVRFTVVASDPDAPMWAPDTCSPNEIRFGDEDGSCGSSVSCGAPPAGQQEPPAEERPGAVNETYTHVYEKPGIYTATLQIESGTACGPDEYRSFASAELVLIVADRRDQARAGG